MKNKGREEEEENVPSASSITGIASHFLYIVQ